MVKEIYGERYLPLNGKKYTVKGICYTICAHKRTAIYPYYKRYCEVDAKHTDEAGKTWFMDILKSEGEEAEILLGKMERDLVKIS